MCAARRRAPVCDGDGQKRGRQEERKRGRKIIRGEVEPVKHCKNDRARAAAKENGVGMCVQFEQNCATGGGDSNVVDRAANSYSTPRV